MKVVIFEYGVAGLSAAHKLINRNFEAEVNEAPAVPAAGTRKIIYRYQACLQYILLQLFIFVHKKYKT